MAARGESRKEANRRMRQEQMREQLRAKGLEQHLIENLMKLQDLGIDLDSVDVQRLKAANDGYLALLKKYLPDMKSIDVEVTGEDGEPMQVKTSLDLSALSTEAMQEIMRVQDASAEA